ncbi:tRNA pseudouridine synthase A [uncultured Corynebacterium sp.]|uniref:tRNA pseudouridine synthase A n=1 Tax=uncultured Corynebacterium sp. TaxID=159447 RepID=UPI002602EDD4|nr:tRNA pseudouridine synthase A [uncultured Corynebacterium sp.]
MPGLLASGGNRRFIRAARYNLLTVTPLMPTSSDKSNSSSSSTCASTCGNTSASTAAELVRLRFDIAYDGTDFHGWAAQRDKPTGEPVRTVQATLESILEKVLRTPVQLTVAGRTDAGVHASGQVAHADVPVSCLDTRSIAGEPGNLVRRVARLLPADVALRDASFAPSGFDARFSALRRHYVYRVTSSVSGPLPTRARDTAHWRRSVDIERMQVAADALLGLNDFAAFCRHKPHATTTRDLQRFQWVDVSTREEPELYEAHVAADAFCWSMVRSLVGACLSVGEGRRAVDFTEQLLTEEKRSPLVPVAEARGLSLVGVDYPEDTDLAVRAEQTRERRDAQPAAKET